MSVIDALEREGGQVIAGYILLCCGAAFSAAGLPKSEDIIVCALTLIARAMLGKNGNK